MKIHFIGVGKMGMPMALHMKAAGHQVSVSDSSRAQMALAGQNGLLVPDDLPCVMNQAELIFSSLPHDDALRQVAAQVADAMRPGAVYVDTSTVSPAVSAEVAALLRLRSQAYLRATVSGNNQMAAAAQLTVMASGPRAAFEQALPLFRLLGPHQFYLGEAEQARLMKLVINLMIAQTSAMLSEALTLGRQGGLDWQDMWQVMGNSAVASPIVKAKAVQLSVRDFTPTFTVEQMIKDVSLILDAGRAGQVALPQTALTLQAMQQAVAQGDGLLDYAAIIRVAERAAGLNAQSLARLQ